MQTNDNGFGRRGDIPPPCDSHGQAALLLVESLIHGLCESATLDTRQAIDVVERAVEVQSDKAEAADGDAAPLWRSHQLLSDIANSLRIDEDRSPPGLTPVA